MDAVAPKGKPQEQHQLPAPNLCPGELGSGSGSLGVPPVVSARLHLTRQPIRMLFLWAVLALFDNVFYV